MRRTHVLQGFLRQMFKTSVFVSDASPSSIRRLSSLHQTSERAVPDMPIMEIACPTAPGVCLQVYRYGSCISAAPLPLGLLFRYLACLPFTIFFFLRFPVCLGISSFRVDETEPKGQ